MSIKIPTKLEFQPGVLKVDSLLAAVGRYVDADKIRFVQGKAQTIGGNVRRYPNTTLNGVPRSALAWTDVAGNTYLVIGTHTRLYCIKNGTEPVLDITPIGASGTLPASPTAGFTTVISTPTVTVTHVAHGLSVGQGVEFAASTVGGLNMLGRWTVATVPTANTYTFTHTSNATSTVSTVSGGGIAFSYDIAIGNINNTPIGSGGWGTTNGWGRGPWGGSAAAAGLGEPRFWSLDLWGTNLTANPTGGTLYTWDTVVARAAAVVGAPLVMRRHVVTESRFVLALSTTDPLVVQWQEQNVLTDWTPGIGKTAGSRRLQGGTRLVNGCTVQGLGNLLWTDTHCFLFTYTGSQFVFDSQITGKDCGLVAPKAFAMANTVPYWMGPQAFHRWVGYVEDIPRQEEIWEWFTLNANKPQMIKSFAHYDADFGEVTWWFPSIGSDEPSRYLKLSLEDFSWTPGTMTRTAVTSFKVDETRPFMTDYNGAIYLHEIGASDNGAIMPWYLQAAPIEIEDGDVNYDVNGYIPDFKRVAGSIDIQLDTYNRIPDSDEAAPLETQVRTFDASAMAGIVDFSANGRSVGVRLSSNVLNTAMRMGTAKLEVNQRGRRR